MNPQNTDLPPRTITPLHQLTYLSHLPEDCHTPLQLSQLPNGIHTSQTMLTLLILFTILQWHLHMTSCFMKTSDLSENTHTSLMSVTDPNDYPPNGRHASPTMCRNCHTSLTVFHTFPMALTHPEWPSYYHVHLSHLPDSLIPL